MSELLLENHVLLRQIHIATVIISITLFVIRFGLLRRFGNPMIRVAPHINDTVLLVSGILLAVNLQGQPFAEGWLIAKLIALVVYIGLGLVALRFARTPRGQLAAFIAAVVVFGYILGVALTRNALVFPNSVSGY